MGAGLRLRASLVVMLLTTVACEENSSSPSRDKAPTVIAAVSDAAPFFVIDAAPAPTTAQLTESIGPVEVFRGGTWQPAERDTPLQADDRLRTGELAFASLRTLDGQVLEVMPNSMIAIDAVTDDDGLVVAGSIIDVAEGSILGRFDKEATLQGDLLVRAADGSELPFRRIPGQDHVTFRISRRDIGIEIATFGGLIEVIPDPEASPTARPTRLNARQAGVISADGVSAPYYLLAVVNLTDPGPDSRAQCASGTVLELEWDAVTNSAGYFVQVARDSAFHQLLASSAKSSRRYQFAPNGMGEFWWRVAARDQRERLGDFGFPRRFFCERDLPKDSLRKPKDGHAAAFDEKNPLVFTWQKSETASKYRLIIARGPLLTADPVVDRTLKRTKHKLREKLPAGHYFWGVYELSDDGERPIFVKVRRLTVAKAVEPTQRKRPKRQRKPR